MQYSDSAICKRFRDTHSPTDVRLDTQTGYKIMVGKQRYVIPQNNQQHDDDDDGCTYPPGKLAHVNWQGPFPPPIKIKKRTLVHVRSVPPAGVLLWRVGLRSCLACCSLFLQMRA